MGINQPTNHQEFLKFILNILSSTSVSSCPEVDPVQQWGAPNGHPIAKDSWDVRRRFE
jgi:hypothetical protein